MRAFLREYFEAKRWCTVDAAEFQAMVEEFHGQSLDVLFGRFVYNAESTIEGGVDGVPEALEHHQM